MKKEKFTRTVGFTPSNTKEAVEIADIHKITFKRRNAHLKAWFGKGNGSLLPSKQNIVG